jgi:hypothetical protein
MSLSKFLEMFDKEMFSQYLTENYLEKQKEYRERKPVAQPTIEQFSWPRYLLDSPVKHLKKISQLRYDHPAKKYVESRKIPNALHGQLFYAPNFNKWVNSFIPDKLPAERTEPRLVIPFINKKNELIGFTGRSFGDELRYVTVLINDEAPKMYGLDRANLNKLTYILEGPIDSMFMPNSVAMAGSDFVKVAKEVGIDPALSVVVFDNEPRNKEIIGKLRKAIKRGWKVCIWPHNVEQKDVNDMVLAGMTPEQIKSIIDKNTFEGLLALTKLLEWKKT